jgi:hypothetical protein
MLVFRHDGRFVGWLIWRKDDVLAGRKSLEFNLDNSTRWFRLTLRSLVWSLVLVASTIAASAQETEPSPTVAEPQASATPTPQDQSEQNPTVVPMPTPDSQETPQLLPESKTLPPQPPETVLPRDLIPQGIKPQIPGAILNPASAEQLEKDKVRFRQLRTIAVRNPEAIFYLRQAKLQHTDELKSEYLRVYYITMCDEMRRLEPRLKLLIDTFENANIGRLSQVSVRPTVPIRDLSRFEAAQKAATSH